MKHCSSIDTDDILFKIVSEAVTSGKVVINGGVFTQGERPDDSEAEDIVINTITVTHDKPQTGTSNVNIYAKDLKPVSYTHLISFLQREKRRIVVGLQIVSINHGLHIFLYKTAH